MTTPTKKTAAASAAPRRPMGSTATGAVAPGAVDPQRKSLEQHVQTIAAGEVMTPTELYDFMESLRATCQALAFFTHAAASQLDAAARKSARERTDDGRLTLADKAKLKLVLRRMSRQMNSGSAESLLASATGAVRAWALMEDFLDSLESSQVTKPHRSGKGGFDPFGGR